MVMVARWITPPSPHKNGMGHVSLKLVFLCVQESGSTTHEAGEQKGDNAMQKRRTAELACRHGTRLQSCSICQPSLPHAYEAFAGTIGEIVEAARPRLLRVAYMSGIGPDEAEDVVQETCIDAWRHLEKLREPERLAAR